MDTVLLKTELKELVALYGETKFDLGYRCSERTRSPETYSVKEYNEVAEKRTEYLIKILDIIDKI